MIPLGELSSWSIAQLTQVYRVSEAHIIALREQHGMTRKQRSERKWNAERMRELLSTFDDADIAKLYGLPVDAIKMIRELVYDV